MTLLSMSSGHSVDCSLVPGVHGFDFCQDSDFFFVPRSCHVDQFTFHIVASCLYVCASQSLWCFSAASADLQVKTGSGGSEIAWQG